jgi:hypothetical protein
MAGKKDDYGLTPKQLRFAHSAVSGVSLAEAYRQSYDAENMSERAVRTEACRLAAHPNVARAMEAIAGEKQAKMQVITVSDRDMLIRNLRRWTKGEDTPTAGQLRAAELLGKACGLYRDVVETRTERPAADVLADIENRLNALGAEPVKQSGMDDDRSDAATH